MKYVTAGFNHNIAALSFQELNSGKDSGGNYNTFSSGNRIVIKPLANSNALYPDINYGSTRVYGYGVGNIGNSWSHLAMVYEHSKSLVSFYVNGVKVWSTTIGIGRLAYPYVRLAGWSYQDKPAKLYIDEFRISDGIARWTEDFTPPTSPYTVG